MPDQPAAALRLPKLAPNHLAFGFGHMMFEQLVTEEFEQRSVFPPVDLHIEHGRVLAAKHGYRFAGKGKVERFPAGDGYWLYRLTVPVQPEVTDAT